ncbi:MAG TPA: hypothetical protein VNT60_11655 [Deinococcales bacterium]|nr:hypothetical protein [Deinococcales bacterium]
MAQESFPSSHSLDALAERQRRLQKARLSTEFAVSRLSAGIKNERLGAGELRGLVLDFLARYRALEQELDGAHAPTSASTWRKP